MLAGFFGIKFLWAGVGFSFIVTLIVNRLLTRKRHGLLLIDGRKYKRQFSFDTRPALEELPALIERLEKFFAAIGLDDGRKIFWRGLIERLFRIYVEQPSRKNFQLEVSLIPADGAMILIIRDNGEPANPLDKLDTINLREKNYIISGDENKLVIVA